MKRIIAILIAALQSAFLFAQADWSVNSTDFEFSVTITGVVGLSGYTVGDGDMVAAFVGDECRGVAPASYVEDYDAYYFYLTVFSNENSGEELSIKYYNSANDETVTDFSTIDFVNGDNLGTVYDPFDFKVGSTPVFEARASQALKTFPNPVVDQLFFELDEPVEMVNVYNAIGKRVISEKDKRKSINVSGLKTGVYFVEVLSKNSRFVGQFIIHK